MMYRGFSVVWCAFSIVLSFSAGADSWKDESSLESNQDPNYKNIHFNKHTPPPWAPPHAQSHRQADNNQGDGAAKTWYDSPQIKFLVASQKIGIESGKCNRGIAKAIVGGDIGDVIGNKNVSDQDNRIIGAITASLITVVAEKKIGRTMEKADAFCVSQVLESAPDDQAIIWNDPTTDNRYMVIPYNTYRQDDGSYCRKYKAAVNAGTTTKYYGDTACRTEDGVWKPLPSS